MFRPIVCGAAAAVLLSGCATTEPGWTGQGAVPFGEAERDCLMTTGTMPEGGERQAAFEECMAGKGWTRD